jgi:hypothetical protein
VQFERLPITGLIPLRWISYAPTFANVVVWFSSHGCWRQRTRQVLAGSGGSMP